MYTVVGWDQPGMSIEMSVLDPILAAVQSLVRQALDDEQAQPAPARKRPLAAVDPSSGSRPASKKSNSSPGAKSALHAVSQSRGWNADMQVREAAAASGTAGCSSLRLQPQRRRKALSQKGFVQRGAGPVRPHHSAPLPFTLARPPSKAPRSYQHPDHPWVPQRQARTHSMDDGPTLEHSSSQETGMPMASKQLVQNLPEPGLQGRLQRTEAGAAGPAASQPAGRTPLEELLSTWDNPCVAPISSIPRLQDLDSLSRVSPRGDSTDTRDCHCSSCVPAAPASETFMFLPHERWVRQPISAPVACSASWCRQRSPELSLIPLSSWDRSTASSWWRSARTFLLSVVDPCAAAGCHILESCCFSYDVPCR